ncbi:hypothetical protein ACEZCY_06720 [Streptacidiphilus sp. N1-12]|uniref:Uncharacterized protein n=2 Tax=Streptacidiphilus alkalitolerans TaxID=3342712 RepID=A0ABV6V5H2_9ACTN
MVEQDQAAMVEAIFEKLVRSVFAPGQDVHDIAEFVGLMVGRLSESNKVNRMDSEALIRVALGEQEVYLEGIGAVDSLQIKGYVAFMAAERLGMSETDIDRLVHETETDLYERGHTLLRLKGSQ